MKILGLFGVILLTVTNCLCATRPNIVLIFADDLGWKDVGYNGASFFETPNIDQLAREGMTFSQAYAPGANCQPSRACLISGNYTPRHSVYAVARTDAGPKELQRMIPIPNKSGLAVENVTIADALKAAGYVTGIFGKWHLGGKEGAAPGQQGFDVVVDTYAGAEMGGELGERERPQKRKPHEDDPKGIYSLTQAAVAFMETNQNRPFFAFVSHHAIHTRLESRPETLKRFQAKKLLYDAMRSIDRTQREQDAHPTELTDPVYAACVYDFDDGVGLLLKALKDLGLEENTLVIFTSDNGGTQRSPQEPLRGNKGCYYEGGIREPFIARWPEKIKPGTTCEVPIINVDFYPTFLAVADSEAPAGKILDGENLVPLFFGKQKLKRESIYWHFPGYLQSPVIRGRDPVFRTRPVSVVRNGDWKLHLYHEEWQLDGGRAGLATNNAVELYNIRRDIGERENLALVTPRKRDQLLRDLFDWMDKVKAPMPTEPNPEYTGISSAAAYPQ
jgi:arylsulfatase A-like enzyme